MEISGRLEEMRAEAAEKKKEPWAAREQPAMQQPDEEQSPFKRRYDKFAKEAAEKEYARRQAAADALRQFAQSYPPRLADRLEAQQKQKEKEWAALNDRLSPQQQDMLPIMDKLPPDFPLREWDTMHPKKQLDIIRKTDLTREEQWAMLNGAPSIRTLAAIRDFAQNRAAYGLANSELDRVTERLQQIGNARMAAQNHAFYLGSDRMQAAYIKYLDEKEEEMLEGMKRGTAEDAIQSEGLGEKLDGWYTNSKKSENSSPETAPGKDSNWAERYTYLKENYGFSGNPRSLVNDKQYFKALDECVNAQTLSSFQKTFVGKARQGIPVDQIAEEGSLVPDKGTLTVGIFAQAEAGVAINGSLGYTIDANGAIWKPSLSLGAGTLSASAGMYYMVTDAPNAEIVGRSRVLSTGASAFIVGMDNVILYDLKTGKTYSGYMLTQSISPKLPLSVEYHALASFFPDEFSD